jgi:outer membrane protein assembly factor BamB
MALIGCGPPVVNTRLANRTVVAGKGTVSFYAPAVGALPLHYQWQSNGTNVPGATNVWLVLTNAQPAQAGSYSMVVSNALGTATSRPAILSVVGPPQIVSQPQNQSVTIGLTTSFFVSAAGTEPLYYQWFFNGAPILDATNYLCNINNSSLSNAGNYSVVVSNAYGSVTSQVAALAVCAPGTKMWEFSAGDRNEAACAIGADRTVYLGSFDHTVYAINGASGAKKWEFVTGNLVASSPAISADGTIYVGSWDAKVYAINGANGTKKWELATGASIVSSPAIGADGTVYVGSEDNVVYAIDGTSGTNKWGFIAGGTVWSSPAIGADGTVYVGSDDFKVYALDGASGAKKWEFVTGNRVFSSPAIGVDGTVYVGSDDHNLYALDGYSGIKKWEFATGGSVHSSPAIGADGTVYVGSLDSNVYAIHGTNGIKKWEFATGNAVYSSPAVGADGTIHVGSDDGKVYALDGATGAKKWEYVTGGAVRSPLAIGPDGTVYFGSYDQKFYAIRSGSLGLAQSSWPKFRQDAKNTGRFKGNYVPSLPSIVSQPQNLTVEAGADASFMVSVTGTPPLTYHWYISVVSGQWSVVSGATNSVLSFPVASLLEAGIYQCVVANTYGSVTSQVATLQITLPLPVSVQGRGIVLTSPELETYDVGQAVTLTATPARWYAFSRWTDGNINNPRTITIGASNTYTAIFTNTVLLEERFSKQWEREYGGSGDDFLNTLQATSDGGAVLGGYSSSGPSGNKGCMNYGGSDYWVVKVDDWGGKQWERAFGGTADDILTAIVVSSEGGYVLVGYSASGANGSKTTTNYGQNDVWLIKLDANGNMVWERGYGGSGMDYANAMIQTGDGGFLVGAHSDSPASGNKTKPNAGGGTDWWILKLDAQGNKQWEAVFGTSGADGVNYVSEFKGGYLVAGMSYGGGGNKTSPAIQYADGWVIKLDPAGNRTADYCYGTWQDDIVYKGTPLMDEGYWLVGCTSPFGDAWLLRIDASGNALVDTRLGGHGAGSSGLLGVVPLSGNTYVAVGSSTLDAQGDKTLPGYGDHDGWLFKFDANGNKIEEWAFGGAGVDSFYQAIQMPDKGLLLAGISNSGATGNKTASNFGGYDYWLVKMAAIELPIGTPRLSLAGQFTMATNFVYTETNTVPIALQSSFANGTIYYTLDGAIPTANSLRYTGPFTLANTNTFVITNILHAVAYSADLVQSAWTDPVQIVIIPRPIYLTVQGTGKITKAPDQTSYATNQSVTLTATPGRWYAFSQWTDGNPTNPRQITIGLTNYYTAIFTNTVPLETMVLGGIAREAPAGTPAVLVNGKYSPLDAWVYANLNSLSLALTSSFPNAIIYYSLDGSEPLTDYTGPLPVATPVLVRAIAYDESFTQSRTNDPVTVTPLLSVEAIGSGSVGISPPSGPYLPDTEVTLTAQASSNWALRGWLGDTNQASRITNTELRIALRTNASISAWFVPVYSVIVDTKAGGAVQLAELGGQWSASNKTTVVGQYLSNTVVRVTATPSNGWAFMEWSGAVSSTNNPEQLTVHSNLHLSASFGTSLGTTTVGAGTVRRAPETGPYPYSSMVRLTALPSPGYYFNRWAGAANGLSNSPLDFAVIVPNTNVTAVFSLLPANMYALNLLIEGDGLVQRQPAQSYYTNGQVVALTATPATSNDVFLGWTGDLGGAGSQANPVMLTMTTNRTVTATFHNTNWYPVIVESPRSVVVMQGAEVVLSVTALGWLPLYYQWQFNGMPVVQATNSSFTIQNSQLSNAGNYLCIVTNAYGSATSQVATVTVTNLPVNQPPLVSLTSPTNGAVFRPGTNINLAATAVDSDGSVARVEFYSGTNLLGSVTNAPYSLVWSNVPVGVYALSARAYDNLGANTLSVPVTVSVLLPSGPAVFELDRSLFEVSESGTQAVVRVLKSSGGAGAINYSTLEGTAKAVNNEGYGDYWTAAGSLVFGALDIEKTVIIAIVDDLAAQGNREFSLELSLVGDGSLLGSPSSATVRIVDDEAPVGLGSSLDMRTPRAWPALGRVRVHLEPGTVDGRWRFSWETAWRVSDSEASGLEPGDYTVDFRRVSGSVAPVPDVFSLGVGERAARTNYYITGSRPLRGSLLVQLQPSGGRWRFQGETVWRSSGAVAAEIAEGEYVVEFEPVSGRVTPAPGRVVVAKDTVTPVSVYYPPLVDWGVSTPAEPGAVPFVNLQSQGNPYASVGQLWSEAGYSSGCVVKERVVLTAAHALFNEADLAFVERAMWFFQRYKDEHEPLPQKPRGWYILSGYAAARSNSPPGQSSLAAYQLDVAAVYFLESAGRAGYSGFLASDAARNWLTGSEKKRLLGYPVSGKDGLAAGRLYITEEVRSGLELMGEGVYGSASFRSYAGNSGGPLCVLHTNGYYYPAGVYLGESGPRSIVRVIDTNVVDLINRAVLSGYTGNNYTGGGVVLLTSGIGGPLFAPGYLKVGIGPAAAANAGAGWRLVGNSNLEYRPGGADAIALLEGDYTVEFKAMAGYAAPANQPVRIVANQIAAISGQYVPNGGLLAPPARTVSGTLRIALTGQVGQTYVLEANSNLRTTNWQPLWTNVMGAGGLWEFIDPASTNLPARFYRARQ